MIYGVRLARGSRARRISSHCFLIVMDLLNRLYNQKRGHNSRPAVVLRRLVHKHSELRPLLVVTEP